jgi:hypothetical protein
MKLRTRRVLMVFALLMGGAGAMDIGLASCDTVKVSVINRSTHSYEVSGSASQSPMTIKQMSSIEGGIEGGQLYGQTCGLIKLVNTQNENDVRYGMVSPGVNHVSIVIHPDSTFDTQGLTEEGFDLKEHQEWYGVGKYLK